ncbi:uncharacterized protein LOC112502315 isoform X2 [Cynara cardunculus var. scolymus]|uniref:uncharacterized protein LOC112502315 isoform X2 n=1 Tax=Cynara cardunculus var. scolymus TaxID=59895 RepID=UPI000D62EAAB|nr:uncharacterized protein LOC112502315 isoform X2 [Cynara cardunculus var. scolymus]
MRSLKVSLLGVHKRTPEQRAESKRIKFENMQSSNDQAKKPQSTKKPMITWTDKTKEKVIDKPLEDEHISSQSTKKPPITYKDKGKAIVTDESSERHRILDKGKKKIIYAPLVKLPGDELDDESEDEVDDESEDESYDPWDSLQAIYGSKKGIVIRSSPPRSPPPPLPVHENKMISSKSIGKRPMQEIIPMDSEKMAVTAATVSGSKSEEPKRRVRHKRVATPSNGTMIYPQDVIDAGKNINPAKKTHYAWFILAPSEEQNRKEPLRPLPVPNVRIKFDWNSHPTVSTLLKYIAMQLRLDSREEVCIFMYGSLLSPEMKLVDVENQWMKIVGPERKTTNIGTSAQYYCIKLTYA